MGIRRLRHEPFASITGPGAWTRKDVEDILFLGVAGVVVGGRLGYCLFYKPGYYLSHPLEIFAVWQGGMAFHGGLLGVLVAMVHVLLPYMILPIYAGLERIPESLLEASADLGARNGTTFRRVVVPIVFPALVAGSIFTFSLTLGDYITPQIVSSTQFIGNVVYINVGVANNLAAAYSLVPIVIMIVYLLAARRVGAFESL